MREIVLDTETTGLDPADGHRIVEIGAIELINHVQTGRHWHRYFNPGRPMPAEALAVHGLADEFLADKPVFAAEVADLLAFIGDARLVIHNAAFDMRFLNAELSVAGLPKLPPDRAFDTLELARRRFPGAPASLDALCRRFGIDTAARVLHGALLDAQLLADVYLEFMGGRQPGLRLDAGRTNLSMSGTEATGPDHIARPDIGATPRPRPLSVRVTEAERRAHEAFVERLGAGTLWPREQESGGG